MARSVMWHGDVKITARSGGGSGLLAALIATAVFAVVVAGLAAALTALVPVLADVSAAFDIAVPGALGLFVLGGIVRWRVGEARLDHLCERSEHRYQRRQAALAADKVQVLAPPLPAALPPAAPAQPTVIDLGHDREPVDLDTLQGGGR